MRRCRSSSAQTLVRIVDTRDLFVTLRYMIRAVKCWSLWSPDRENDSAEESQNCLSPTYARSAEFGDK